MRIGKPNRIMVYVVLYSFYWLTLCPRLLLGEDAKDDDKDDKSGEVVKIVQGKQKNLTIPIGLSRTLEFNFEIGPIYLTDPSLFDFKRVKDGSDKDKKLLIIPKNSGSTDMTIHDINGQPRITYLIRITREDLGQVTSQLEDLLGDIEGLKIRSLGGTLILDGEILLPRDMIRIFRVLDAIKDRDPKKKEVPIRNLTSISKLTMNILAERIEREIGSPEITARVVNNNIFLEGTAESDFEADRAVEFAKTYLPEVFVDKTKGEGGEVKPKAAGGIGGGLPSIVDLLRVRPRQPQPASQDIKITMNYVELNNDYSKSFSFNWSPLVGDSGQVKYDTSVGELTANLVATVSSLLPKLVTAKDHGHARILKQQQVIVKDRAEAPAIIDSSLQIYSRIVDEKGGVAFQPIEIRNSTKVKASTIPGSDNLDLGIQIELSSPVQAGAGPPSVAKNILQTQVTIKNGESAALGGNAVDQALAAYNKPATSGTGGGGAQANQSPALHADSRQKLSEKQIAVHYFHHPRGHPDGKRGDRGHDP